jgi:basic membrane protein A
MVKDTLAQMLAGDFDRFDVFSGPINDNQGNVVVPEGEQMTQADLDQFPPPKGFCEGEYCMLWWADGINAALPDLDDA